MRYAALLPAGVLSLLTLPMCVSAHAQVVVTPDTAVATEGDIDNAIPFNSSFAGQPTQRYQQVYASSLFSALTSPELITQITFRPDANTPFANAFASTLPDIQINLSTTGAAEDALSNTFADNIGSNDTTVVPRGALSLSSADTGPAGGPRDFDITISLTTPFLYDPSSGNLLLDVRNFGGGFTTQFDAVFTQSDGVSRVFSLSSVTDTSGGTDTVGLVTQFTFTPAPVPEPGSVALVVGMGLSGARFLAHRRKNARQAA